MLEGLRGEESIAALCRREGIPSNLYYRWSKEFLEAGKEASDDIERFEWVARWLGLKGAGSRSPVQSRRATVHAFRYHPGASVGRPGSDLRR